MSCTHVEHICTLGRSNHARARTDKPNYFFVQWEEVDNEEEEEEEGKGEGEGEEGEDEEEEGRRRGRMMRTKGRTRRRGGGCR